MTAGAAQAAWLEHRHGLGLTAGQRPAEEHHGTGRFLKGTLGNVVLLSHPLQAASASSSPSLLSL